MPQASKVLEKQWPKLLCNPLYVGSFTAQSKKILDTLEWLMPPELNGDRYVLMSRWLAQAETDGLITAQEHFSLRNEIAQSM